MQIKIYSYIYACYHRDLHMNQTNVIGQIEYKQTKIE